MVRQRFDSCLVICHGKSELIFAESIRSNLRLKFAIYAHKNGKNNIQITSLLSHLNNANHKTLAALQRTYSLDVQRKVINNFKVFIIMDFDEQEYTDEIKQNFLNKKMFDGHYLQQYIVPIYNIKNFDDVFIKAGYPIDTNNKKISYEKVFPGNNGDYEEFLKVKTNIDKLDKSITNIHKLLDYLYIQYQNKIKY